MNKAPFGISAKYIDNGRSNIIFSKAIDSSEFYQVFQRGYHLFLLIHSVVLVRKKRTPSGHWEVYLCCSENLSAVKLDLRSNEYVILLGAKIPEEGEEVTANKFPLPRCMQFSAIVDIVYELSREKGKWTGGEDYNCQDFAIALLEKLGVIAGSLQVFKADRSEAKNIYSLYYKYFKDPDICNRPSIDNFADGVFKNGLEETLGVLRSSIRR